MNKECCPAVPGGSGGPLPPEPHGRVQPVGGAGAQPAAHQLRGPQCAGRAGGGQPAVRQHRDSQGETYTKKYIFFFARNFFFFARKKLLYLDIL